MTSPEPAILLYRGKQKGRGKFGGLPDLPADIDWPRMHGTGIPLTFLAQVDLSALPTTPLEPGGPTLPDSGALFFFARTGSGRYNENGDFIYSDCEHWMEDEEDDGRETRVIYAPTFGDAQQAPEDLEGDKERIDRLLPGDFMLTGIFPEKPFAPCLVESGMDDAEALERQLGEPIPVAPQQGDVTERYRDQIAWVVSPPSEHRPETRSLRIAHHQIFGLAPTVQHENGSARHQTDRNGAPGIPLLTIDTDWGIHRKFVWCDWGLIQFWIKPQHLAERRFDKVYATTEGS